MRLQNLDVLRGVAIVLVLGRHMDPFPPGGSLGIQRAAELWARIGWVGVDLFFVLSGFLVSGILFREYRIHGSIHAGRFFWRRGLKIYPAFHVFVAGTLLLQWLGVAMPHPATLLNTASEILFVQNYQGSLHYHTWSLAVEEHFYLSLPAVLVGLLWLARRTGRMADPFLPVLPLALAVCAACLALRIDIADLRYSHRTHLFPTHLRIDSLFVGVAISYLHAFHRGRFGAFVQRHTRELRLGCVMLLLPMTFLPLEHPFVHVYGFSMLSLGFGCLLVLALEEGPRRERRLGVGAALAAIGVYSYSIYLWHVPVKYVVAHLLAGTNAGNHGPRTLVYLVASIVFGMMMARIVEVPTLRLRDRRFPSRSELVEAPASFRSSRPGVESLSGPRLAMAAGPEAHAPGPAFRPRG